MLGTRTRRPRGSDAPSGPAPLGENITFSSPPLKPRGLLLSVMRQKVGKERSQEGFAPLANPRFFQTVPRRMFGLAPTPRAAPPLDAEAGDAKHRDGFRRYFRPKARPSSPDGGHRYPTQQACAARHTTGQPLSQTEAGDSESRDLLRPKLGRDLPMTARRLPTRRGRDLPMTAAATPRGRPQHAAPRDEMAPSASSGRETTLPTVFVRAPAKSYSNAEHAFERFPS